jgi:ABC-type antimicrobial peptide transport system permease subunit
MIVGESARLLFVGSAIGLAAALFAARPLTLFFVPGLTGGDPLTFVGVATVLLLTGIAATLGPVRRAVRVDPAVSLRYE